MSDKRKPSDKDDTFVFGDEDQQPAHKKPEAKPAAERSFTARTTDPNRFGNERTRVQSGTTEEGTAVRARNVLNEAFDARTVVRPMAALPPEPKIDLSNPKIPLPPPEREEPRQARRSSSAQPERTPPPERAPERPREERAPRQSRSQEPQQPQGWSENSIPPMPEPPKPSSRRSSREREEVREHTFPPEMTPAPIPHAPPPGGVQMSQDYYEEEVEARPRRSPMDLLQQKPVAIGIGIAIFTIAAAFFFSSEDSHQTSQSSERPPAEIAELPPPEPEQPRTQHRPETARPQSGQGGGMPSIGTVDSLLNQFDQSYSKTQGQIGGN